MSRTRRVVLRDGALAIVGLAAGVGCAKTTDTGAGAEGADGAGGGTGAADGTGGTDGTQAERTCEDPTAGSAGWTALPLADHPALATVGEGVQVDMGGRRLAVAHYEDGCYAAVDRICTHQGCDTAYSSGRFVCPCHGAVFDLDGQVVSGPTSVPVDAFPAIRVDDVVWIKLD